MNNMASPSDESSTSVGPYIIGKTLGIGTTGRVKLGTHSITGERVAIKIISRSNNEDAKTKSMLQNVEREITVMKLVDHPHILRLHDVYESTNKLFLVMELVADGELFDYLVSKGRLSMRESLKYFRQITEAMAFCHSHCVCHRDLKPENLLLDRKHGIKIADFGMASLQGSGKMLKTSCGSPHYAAPEVVRGEKYDGRAADIWSCGVMLYALLSGTLPFDAPKIHQVLAKVKTGKFSMPQLLPQSVQELIQGMLTLDPEARWTMQQIRSHSWYVNGDDGTNGENKRRLGIGEESQPWMDVQLNFNSNGEEPSFDMDILSSMNSLGCFNKETIITALLAPDVNTEKVVYSLLASHKRRFPSREDVFSVSPSLSADVAIPRKRTDSCDSMFLDEICSLTSAVSSRSSTPTSLTSRLSDGNATSKRSRSGSDSKNMIYLSSGNSTRRSRAVSNPQVMKQVLINNMQSRTSLANADAFDFSKSLLDGETSAIAASFDNVNLEEATPGSPRFHRVKVDDSDNMSDVSNVSYGPKKSWFESFFHAGNNSAVGVLPGTTNYTASRPSKKRDSSFGNGSVSLNSTSPQLSTSKPMHDICKEVVNFFQSHCIKYQSSCEGTFKAKADGEKFVDSVSKVALKFRVDIVAIAEGDRKNVSIVLQQGAEEAFLRVVAMLVEALGLNFKERSKDDHTSN